MTLLHPKAVQLGMGRFLYYLFPDNVFLNKGDDLARASRNPPLLTTENLLENTDGAPRQRPLGAAPCYLLVMLTRALLMLMLMPSLVHRPRRWGWMGWATTW